MSVHYLDLVPLRLIDDTWVENDCWRDRPIHDVVIGCGACGWRGRSLGLSPDDLAVFYGDLDDEVAFSTAQAEFDARHLAEVVMAGVVLTASEDLVDQMLGATLTV
jgi:hypothetical protein